MFWAGLALDTTGTKLMGRISEDALTLNFHSITGLIAIILMFVHAVWSTWVLIKTENEKRRDFIISAYWFGSSG
mgnify:CR=1 FL=1